MSESGVDRRGRLEVMPFALQRRKDGTVIISWRGKTVMTLRGRDAASIPGANRESRRCRRATVDGQANRQLQARQRARTRRLSVNGPDSRARRVQGATLREPFRRAVLEAKSALIDPMARSRAPSMEWMIDDSGHQSTQYPNPYPRQADTWLDRLAHWIESKKWKDDEAIVA